MDNPKSAVWRTPPSQHSSYIPIPSQTPVRQFPIVLSPQGATPPPLHLKLKLNLHMHASICFVFVLCCAVFAYSYIWQFLHNMSPFNNQRVFEKAAYLHHDGLATSGWITRWIRSAKFPFEVERLSSLRKQEPSNNIFWYQNFHHHWVVSVTLAF